MRALPSPFVAMILLIILMPQLVCAESGFKLPNLNPFAKKESEPARPAPSSVQKKSVMPSLPKINVLPKKQPGQPSTWEKLGASTKGFLSKTINVLTFGKLPPERSSSQPKLTGTQRMYNSRTRTAHRETNKTSFFPWLKPKDEPAQPPGNVSDWLKQPRVPVD